MGLYFFIETLEPNETEALKTSERRQRHLLLNNKVKVYWKEY